MLCFELLYFKINYDSSIRTSAQDLQDLLLLLCNYYFFAIFKTIREMWYN